jgi:hypothetical protein
LFGGVHSELIRLKSRGKGFSEDDVSMEVALVFNGFGVFNANTRLLKWIHGQVI